MSDKKTVVVLSGGMDSTTLLYKVLKESSDDVYALSFNYKQRHLKELEFASKTCEKLGVEHVVADISSVNNLLQGSALTSQEIDVPEGHYTDETMRKTVVPNRNSILLNLAIGYVISISANEVAYAAHSGDHAVYPDCRPVFLDKIRELAKVVDYEPIGVYAPFMEVDKAQIVRDGAVLGVDYSLTWSCYKGGDKPCGKCGTCVERLEAFEWAGVEDPLQYE